MAHWYVEWQQDSPVEVASVADLDRVLDRLTSETLGDHPIVVVLVGPTGDTLSMGVGQGVSVLSFVAASGDPPYLASVGDRAATGEIAFYSYGHWSEFPRHQCVPMQTARQVMREFFERGKLSEQIEWEEV